MRVFYIKLFARLGVLSGLLTLSLQYKHLLSILVRLEAITIRLFILILSMSNDTRRIGYTSLILITLGACEARLGLSVLVSVIRREGNDYVSRFSNQKC